MVSLAARSATVGFPEHTTALILIRKGICMNTCTWYVYAHVEGECNLQRIDISPMCIHSYWFSYNSNAIIRSYRR